MRLIISMNALWIFVMASSVIGALLLISSAFASGAPQQAAGAAMGVGCAAIPYVFVRALSEIRNNRTAEVDDD